jgi:hypothetical protein
MDPTSLEALVSIAQDLPTLRSEVRLARRSYRFTIGVVAIAILTGAVLFWNQYQADVVRDRDARQYILDQCERSNASRKLVADAFDKERKTLLAASGGGSRTSEQQQRIDAYNAGIDELIASFAPRDCAALTKAAVQP